MHRNAGDIYGSGSGIEIFVFDGSGPAAIYSIGILCTESFHIEVGRSLADFFVGRKGDAQRPVRNGFVGKALAERNDFSNARLIVGP